MRKNLAAAPELFHKNRQRKQSTQKLWLSSTNSCIFILNVIVSPKHNILSIQGLKLYLFRAPLLRHCSVLGARPLASSVWPYSSLLTSYLLVFAFDWWILTQRLIGKCFYTHYFSVLVSVFRSDMSRSWSPVCGANNERVNYFADTQSR